MSNDPATDDTVFAESDAASRDTVHASEDGPSKFAEPNTDDDLERGLAYAAARRRLLGELDAEPPRLGQYYLLETIGSGAMGVVFAAYDPDLDRKVAIKLLRAGPDDSQGRQRLQREARALARLTHPNVVTVHGIGTQEGQPWVAMEFVSGCDLREWLGQHERPWMEVLEVFVAAARGLAAAHSADVVHRDFKPANVLIGDDGVPRVADFGLARPAGIEEVATEPDDSLSSHDSLRSGPSAEWRDAALTKTRGMVGTPVYMAPEQYVSSEVGPAADQYAFFVSLYEGLYGTLPFDNHELLALVEAKASATVAEPPRDAKVPRWLHRIILRGLSAKPEDRFASMDAVIARIDSDRRRASGGGWRLWLGAAAIAAIAAGIGGRLAADPTPADSAAELCAESGAPVDDAWYHRRDAIGAAVLGTELPYAADSWEWIDQEMNEVAGAWATARRELCEGGVDGTIAADVVQRRVQCLDEKLASVVAVTDLFARADADILSATDRLLALLGRPEDCMGDGPLKSLTLRPSDPQARQRGDAVMARIEALHALRIAGKRDEARTETEALRELLDDDLEPLVRGELQRVLSLAVDQAKPEHGELLRGALADAIRARGERLAIMVYYDLGIHEATLGRPGRAVQYYELGLATADRVEAVAKRLGTEWSFIHVLRPALETVMGVALREHGKGEESLEHLRRAAEMASDVRSRFTFVPMEAYNNYAEGLRVTGSYEEALQYYDRAIEVGRETMGMRHPNVGQVLNNRGAAFVDLGRYEDGRRDLELGREIRRSQVGENHPDVALLDYNLSLIDINTGHPDRARVTLEHVRKVWEAKFPKTHPYRIAAKMSQGTAARHAGDVEEALTLATEARDEMHRLLGDRPHVLIATVDAEYALALVAAGRADEAVKAADDAVKGFEKSVGLNNAAASVGLFAQGEVARERGEHDAALAAFDRSITVLSEHVSPEHPELAWPLVGRAEVQHALGNDDTAGASLARGKTLTTPGAIPTELEARIAALNQALAAD